MLTQIALVPIFLSHWDEETYGVWLAIQAAIALTTLIDVGHQTFIGFEFLRLGPDRRHDIKKVFSAAIPIGFLLGIIELFAVIFVVWQGWDRNLLGLGKESTGAGLVLIIQSVVWVLTGSVGGLAGRILAPFGYFARFAWWGVFAGIVTSIAPAVAVWNGANLLQTGIWLAVATIAFNVPIYFDLWRFMRREQVLPGMPEWALGFRNLWRSAGLTVKTLFEMSRQQGARLVLTPLAGASELAAFATMRTGANVALQGLGTITNPLMPELMRFLVQRDQQRMEAAFGVVWLMIVVILAPGVIFLQLIAPEVFPIWTRGKIDFDGVLFAVLSLGVLVFALAQPPMAVVQGNNLLRPQLILSAISGMIVIGGMFLLVPFMGIRGAALALLIAEVAALIGYALEANYWLRMNELRLPGAAFRWVAMSVGVAGGGMLVMGAWPLVAWKTGLGSLILLACAGHGYWRSFSPLARERVAQIMRSRLPLFLRTRLPL